MLDRLVMTAGIVALSAGLASAQTATPPASGVPGTMAASRATASGMKDWQVARMAKTSLTQALSTAEAQGEKGGRAIDADFEMQRDTDPAHYAVKVVYPSGKLVEYGINADTGALYKTENQPIERYFTFLKPANFNEAKTSLREAIAIAEAKASGGKAYEASVSKDGKAVQYEIKVAGADKEQTVKVGADGKVVD